MKKYLLILIVLLFSKVLIGQTQEAQQLLLNVEKLAQFKKILQNMKDGYQMLHRGYTTIKDLSQGNFNLHKTFLDALMEVSPIVRKYKRITDIIVHQGKIIKEYKLAFNEFKAGGQFSPDEVDYLSNVYRNLLKEGVKSLEELSMVITGGKLRMSDDERLQTIDHIYTSIVEQYGFLQEFNNSTAMLALQRKSEKAEIKLSKRLSSQK